MKPVLKKVAKVASETTEFRVWCEYCCIRISPNEERIPMEGKVYHQRCYPKHAAASRTKKAAGGKK
jgi:hypothetical protein